VARSEIRFLAGGNKEGQESDEEEPEIEDDEEAFAEFAQEQVQRGIGILSTLCTEFPKYHFKPSPESARAMFESTSARYFALISILLESEALGGPGMSPLGHFFFLKNPN